jgi:hypothetical protein
MVHINNSDFNKFKILKGFLETFKVHLKEYETLIPNFVYINVKNSNS